MCSDNDHERGQAMKSDEEILAELQDAKTKHGIGTDTARALLALKAVYQIKEDTETSNRAELAEIRALQRSIIDVAKFLTKMMVGYFVTRRSGDVHAANGLDKWFADMGVPKDPNKIDEAIEDILESPRE